MSSEGTRTGLKRPDIEGRRPIEFESGYALTYEIQEDFFDGSTRLVLDTFTGAWLVLHGYFNDEEEFIELHREHEDRHRR